jgi:ferredoxin
LRTGRYAAVDAAVCLGCGACLGACERQAISLVPRPHAVKPPRDKGILFTRILWEKGRLLPFVTDRLKSPWRALRRRRNGAG